MAYSDEFVARVKELWDEGLSASQIAGLLKSGSRSTILGIAFRRGWSRDARRPRKPTQARFKPGLVPTPPSLPPEPAPLPVRPVKNGDQQWHHCRFGFGDPATEEFRFCGATRTKGWYCAVHWNLCNVPAPHRKTA